MSLRIVAQGPDGLLDATRVQTAVNRRVEARLHLANRLADGDGDAVPDSFDDCPLVPDPLQLDTSGVPPGDACPPGHGCPAGALLCDDFEAATLDTSKWTSDVSSDGSAVAIDGTHSHSGKSALLSRNQTSKNYESAVAAIFEGSTLSPTAPDLYMRAFVYVPSDFPAATTTLFRVGTSSDSLDGVELQLAGLQLQVVDHWGTAPSSPQGGQIGYDAWYCIEWNLRVRSSAGTNRVWIAGPDGNVQEVGVLDMTLFTAVDGISQIGFGLRTEVSSKPITARSVWIDDVAIGAARIGCGS
jgi:hypothetical protein